MFFTSISSTFGALSVNAESNPSIQLYKSYRYTTDSAGGIIPASIRKDMDFATQDYVISFTSVSPTNGNNYILNVLKYDGYNNLVWARQIKSTNTNWYIMNNGAVKITTSGTVYAYYSGSTSGTADDLFIVKFSSGGTNSWNKKISKGSYSQGLYPGGCCNKSSMISGGSMCVYGEDLFIVMSARGNDSDSTSISIGTSTGNREVLVKLSGSTGAVAWSTNHLHYETVSTTRYFRWAYSASVAVTTTGGQDYVCFAYNTMGSNDPGGVSFINVFRTNGTQINGTSLASTSYSSSTQMMRTAVSNAFGFVASSVTVNSEASTPYFYINGTYSPTATTFNRFRARFSVGANSPQYDMSFTKVLSSGTYLDTTKTSSSSLIPLYNAMARPYETFSWYIYPVTYNAVFTAGATHICVQSWNTLDNTLNWSYIITISGLNSRNILYNVDYDPNLTSLTVTWSMSSPIPSTGVLTTFNYVPGESGPFKEGTHTLATGQTISIAKDTMTLVDSTIPSGFNSPSGGVYATISTYLGPNWATVSATAAECTSSDSSSLITRTFVETMGTA